MNFLIFGSSFSGSTVLSGMLGAHPEIFTCGELAQWYLQQLPGREGYFSRKSLGNTDVSITVCRKCGYDHCKYWTEAPVPEDPTELYRVLRKHLGYQHLVDSSKHPTWYEQIIPRCPEDYFVAILLHKPVWSMLTSRARYLKLGGAAQLPVDEARRFMEFWAYFYRGFREILDNEAVVPVNVRYEDLATKPWATLERILTVGGLYGREHQPLSVEQPQMREGFNLPLHQIAGNSKLKLRVGAMREAKKSLPLMLDAQLNEAPQPVREACLEHRDVRELMEWLGRGEELPS